MIQYENAGKSFFHFLTMHAFDERDRWTDRQILTAIPCLCIHSRTVKR